MARRPMPTPVETVQDPETRELRITWSDGHRSRFAFRTLRLRCPCAVCVHEWTGEALLDPTRVPESIHPREMSQVGAYALRFVWSDSHATGIYTFTFLRALCECEECVQVRREAQRPPG